MHPPAIRQSALELISAGVNDCEIARRLALPRTTVRDMRWTAGRADLRTTCLRCWRAMPCVVFTDDDYAELLGLYLGDGHIAQLARTQKLRISLDAAHVQVVADTEVLLRRCFPHNCVSRVTACGGTNVIPYVYHAHLACLFPQAGPGKKHERLLVLEAWQYRIVEAAPWALLRGLIRSDGCIFVNRTGRYEYVSYDFANLSVDILDLFTRTCERLGLRPRRYARHVRLYRREDVARLLAHGVTKT
jgi:hypothetical protein